MDSTCFSDCARELIDHGGQEQLDRWHASVRVREFTRQFCHSYFHYAKLKELSAARALQEEASSPLMQALGARSIPEVEDFHPDFPSVYLFHTLLEEHHQVPTFEEFWTFFQSGTERAKSFDQFDAFLAGLSGYSAQDKRAALARRVAYAYCASFYELWTAAWLREKAGIEARYHLFADTQLQTDLWYGETIVCLRIPSAKLSRKRDPSAWASAFHVVHIDIQRAESARMPLPTEEQLRTLVALEMTPGTVSTITADSSVIQEHPIAITTKVSGSVAAAKPTSLPLAAALEQLGLTSQPRYSLTFIACDPSEAQAASLLREGLKVYVLSASPAKYPELAAYEDARLLHVQACAFMKQDTKPQLIVDGVAAPETARLFARIDADSRTEKDFNWGQYAVEHAPPNEHMRVRAGAGTGKTWVMVQRVLFLLHACDGLSPRDITMVTFTREATRIMRERLRQALEVRYRLTGKPQYLDWLEDLSFMHISTIHSFARRLLKAVGSTLGYGQDVQIREFTLERRRILDQLLDEHLRHERKQRAVADMLAMPLYRFIQVADRYWHEMENKGLTPDDVKVIEWGQPLTPDSATIQSIWEMLFSEAEGRLQAYKQSSNAISLSDLTRQLRLATQEPDAIRRSGLTIKHLFVDEFQDTDDTQIDLVASIHTMLDARVFVVGDIKQSIYRFRGATYTAFDVLADKLAQSGVTMREHTLRKNYRTASNVLERLGEHFVAWGEQGWLPYQKEEALTGGTATPGDLRMSIVAQKWQGLYDPVVDLIREAYELSRQQNTRAAVLVRTNWQVEHVKRWCEAEDIPCATDIGGAFFRSPAVADFLALVTALLYPHEPIALLTLLASPYSAVTLPWAALLQSKGDREQLLTLLDTPDLKPHTDWDDLVQRSRLQPILSIIREAMTKMQPVQRFYDRRLTEVLAQGPGQEATGQALARETAAQDAGQYERNLDRLMELLHDTFSEEFLTLFRIRQWLLLQKATNDSEDQPRPPLDEQAGGLYCMTVHKAKGNEFDSVIVPFTSQRFRIRRSELILDKDKQTGRWTAGWQLIIEDGQPFWLAAALSNSCYSSVSTMEKQEAFREETRLLYVALTRAKQKLWTLAYDQGKENWGYLLRTSV